MDTPVKPAYDDELNDPQGFFVFFALSKTIGVMLYPTNFLIGIGLIGAILLATRFASIGRKLLVASVVLLAVGGFSPLGNWLLYPLESRFPAWDATRGAPDGIIVLGGPIDPEMSRAHDTPVFRNSADRMIAAAALAHRYPKARIVYSGGNANLVFDDSARETDYAVAIFEELGIPRQRLMMEGRSRNTAENAEFSKALAVPKSGERWLLVTAAYHMPRSVGVFRKAGFAVEPYPVDWRVGGRSDLLAFSAYSIRVLGRVETALREWIGLAAYRISGRTGEFFPGPDQGVNR
jgi:uncharacterized SAM-binding protein YcdF (DUF218 family)